MGAELYLMCEDFGAAVQSLGERGVQCAPVEKAEWGSFTTLRLPGGGKIGLF